jgi:hypothetical protein
MLMPVARTCTGSVRAAGYFALGGAAVWLIVAVILGARLWRERHR